MSFYSDLCLYRTSTALYVQTLHGHSLRPNPCVGRKPCITSHTMLTMALYVWYRNIQRNARQDFKLRVR